MSCQFITILELSESSHWPSNDVTITVKASKCLVSLNFFAQCRLPLTTNEIVKDEIEALCNAAQSNVSQITIALKVV